MLVLADFVFRGRVFETFLHMLGLGFKLFLAVRARFTLKHDQIGNDVRRHPAFDFPDVRGRFMIDAAELHRSQTFSGDLDSRNAFFGSDAGMRF